MTSKAERKRLRKQLAEAASKAESLAVTTHYVAHPELTLDALVSLASKAPEVCNVAMHCDSFGPTRRFAPESEQELDIGAHVRMVERDFEFADLLDSLEDSEGLVGQLEGQNIFAVSAKLRHHPVNMVMFWALLSAVSTLPNVIHIDTDDRSICYLKDTIAAAPSTDFFDQTRDNTAEFGQALVDYPSIRVRS